MPTPGWPESWTRTSLSLTWPRFGMSQGKSYWMWPLMPHPRELLYTHVAQKRNVTPLTSLLTTLIWLLYSLYTELSFIKLVRQGWWFAINTINVSVSQNIFICFTQCLNKIMVIFFNITASNNAIHRTRQKTNACQFYLLSPWGRAGIPGLLF